MTDSDNVILEYLNQTGVALNKRGLEINLQSENADISYSTIKRRVEKLEQAGLIEEVDPSGPWYQISEKGEAYLGGNLDLRESKLD